MFCFDPLLAMETMIPTPARITTPITIQVGSMFCRIPSFQSAARTPPMSKANPKKYIPAHFMAHLLGSAYGEASWSSTQRKCWSDAARQPRCKERADLAECSFWPEGHQKRIGR